MNRSPSRHQGFLALLLLLGIGNARADFIYNWKPDSPNVKATSGKGHIHLSDEPAVTATDSTDVVAANLRTVHAGSAPDVYHNVAWGLTVKITDLASHKSGSLHFAGLFNGTVTAGSAHVLNTFTGPSTLSIQLGKNVYTVTLDAYTPPGPPSSKRMGSLGAFIEVAPAASLGPLSVVPEPSTLILAGLGVSGVGASWWRRRRNGLPESVV
jgi:hypothetical protein